MLLFYKTRKTYFNYHQVTFVVVYIHNTIVCTKQDQNHQETEQSSQ